MKKKRIAIALGHDALGTTLPEQKEATCRAAKAIADLIQDDCQVVITHSNGPQIGMIHTAMSEFHRLYTDYTATPMSVCSAMSQGYIGYDLQNAIRTRETPSRMRRELPSQSERAGGARRRGRQPRWYRESLLPSLDSW